MISALKVSIVFLFIRPAVCYHAIVILSSQQSKVVVGTILVWISSLKRGAVALDVSLLTNLALNDTVDRRLFSTAFDVIVSIKQKLTPLIVGAKIEAIFKLIVNIPSASAVIYKKVDHALAHVKLSYSLNDRVLKDLILIVITFYMDCRRPMNLAC